MRSLREIIFITLLSASALLSSCKTEEPFVEPFTPVPIGALDLSLEESIAIERQEELEGIIREYEVPYVADIIYYDESNRSRFQAVMDREYGMSKKRSYNIWNQIGKSKKPFAALTLVPHSQMGKKKPSVMIVRSALFSYSKKDEDRVSTIVDHEGFHAKDNATGLYLGGERVFHKKVGEKLFASIMELRAYHNQLVEIAKGRDVSHDCRIAIGVAYRTLYDYLRARSFNGNKYAQAALKETKYIPVIDLDTQQVHIIKRGEFFKGSGFENCKECPEKHK